MKKLIKPVIFISHIHEDADVAKSLKEFLNDAFLGLFDIFVSGDGASIRAGDNWSAMLEQSLHDAEVVVALISNEAVERRWIYFETGGAYFLRKRVIPLCIRGFPLSRLGLPLSWLQAIEADNENTAKYLIQEIARTFELKVPKVDFDELTKILLGEKRKSRSIKKPGGEIATRPLPIFLVVDSSGSMFGERIELVHSGIEILVDLLRQIREPNYEPILSLITFGSEVNLIVSPTPVVSLDGIPSLQAGGATNFGSAMSYLSKLLDDPAIVPHRSLPPLIIFILDGSPTDNWLVGLKRLLDTVWGRKASRICLALGEDIDYATLRQIASHGVLPLLKATDVLELKNFFRWVSTLVSSTLSKPTAMAEIPKVPSGLEVVDDAGINLNTENKI